MAKRKFDDEGGRSGGGGDRPKKMVRRAPLAPKKPYQAKRRQRGFLGGRSEAKFINLIQSPVAINATTPIVSHVDVVPNGTTVNSREGKTFRNTAWMMRGSIISDTTTTVAQAALYLVWDYLSYKTLPAVSDILDTADTFGLPKRENNTRFKIIKKWRYVFASNTTTPTSSKVIHDIDEYVRLPKDCIAECTSTDTTGVIGNRVKGALLLVAVGSQPAGTGDVTLQFQARVNFTDDLE